MRNQLNNRDKLPVRVLTRWWKDTWIPDKTAIYWDMRGEGVTVKDISGNNNDGVIFGASDAYSGLDYDSVAGPVARINWDNAGGLPRNNSLSNITNGIRETKTAILDGDPTAVTVMMWIKNKDLTTPNTISPYAHLKYDYIGEARILYKSTALVWENYGNGFRGQVVDSNNNPYVNNTSTAAKTLGTNSWHNLTCVFTAGKGPLVYIDTVDAGDNSPSGIGVLESTLGHTNGFYFTVGTNAKGNYMRGYVGTVVLVKRVLSDAEIKRFYDETRGRFGK